MRLHSHLCVWADNEPGAHLLHKPHREHTSHLLPPPPPPLLPLILSSLSRSWSCSIEPIEFSRAIHSLGLVLVAIHRWQCSSSAKGRRLPRRQPARRRRPFKFTVAPMVVEVVAAAMAMAMEVVVQLAQWMDNYRHSHKYTQVHAHASNSIFS